MAIIDYPITTNFHGKDWFHPNPHTGIDLAVPLFTPIVSQDSGIVSLTTDKWLGNAVRLKLKNGETIVYGHISKYEVYDGQCIDKNQLLALSGGDPKMPNQGRTTGPHVHVTLINSSSQIVSPYNYLFNHDNFYQNNNNSSPFLFSVMLIILFIVLWKCKKVVAYGLGILFLLSIVFIVS